MDFKRWLSRLRPQGNQGPLVRIDGSLSGSALLENGALERLQEVVRAVSSNRPYHYDLDLSASRFSLILVEPILPKEAFEPDLETALTQDLQNVLEALPPGERPSVQCTFRVLWQEAGEVTGVVFLVDGSGRVTSEKRIRPGEEYDRLVERQAAESYFPPARPRLPRWAAFPVAFMVLALGALLVYFLGPERNFRALAAVMEKVEMKGLDRFVSIQDIEVGRGGMAFTLVPLENYGERIGEVLKIEPPPSGQEEASSGESRELLLMKRAAEALLLGRLHLDLFDDQGILLERIPLDLTGFDGTAEKRVKTRPLNLPFRPARAAMGP